MKIDEFHSKYNLSYYRIAQIVGVVPSAVLHWKRGSRKEPKMLGLFLDLQSLYFEKNGKFYDKGG